MVSASWRIARNLPRFFSSGDGFWLPKTSLRFQIAECFEYAGFAGNHQKIAETSLRLFVGSQNKNRSLSAFSQSQRFRDARLQRWWGHPERKAQGKVEF